MQINIQYRRGQYRILQDGKVRRYAADYGEIIETKGADGDPIDVYRGLFPHAQTAFIINQYHDNGAFDEHKIMLHFYDEAQAKSAYELTCEKPVSQIFACTQSQLDWWLQYGNHKQPVSAQSFPFDSENINMTQEYTPNWTNENQTAAQLVYAWRKNDEYGELTEPATLDCILFDEMADGAEVQAATFDALAVENKRLERTAQLLGNALNRVSGSLKVVENGIHISAPMKKNGTTNIAVMYEMTDGQTVSVLFHNPDTTPQKITPDDVLISWKWLLNRKDITIVVAKENGKDLPLPTVARRVMALVEKNTARFAKANANKAAETEELNRLQDEKTAKLARLEELNQMAEQRENSLNLSKLILPENASPKELGAVVHQWLKQNLQGKSIIAANGAKIFFNRNFSIDHLSHDGRRSQLAAQSIPFIVEVFKNGAYQGKETLKKARNDGIVAFHLYEKWVQLENGMRLYLRAKAAEFDDGRFEAHGDSIAYTQRILDMENRKRLPSNPVMDNAFGGLVSDVDYDNAVLVILQVLDENGNEIDEADKNSGSLNNGITQHLSTHLPTAAHAEMFEKAENFLNMYWHDDYANLANEKKTILREWLAENRLPDFMNSKTTNSYQELADYLGEGFINQISSSRDFRDNAGHISLSKIRKRFLYFSMPHDSMALNAELKGDELGVFDTSSQEGKAQLRQAARAYLESLRGKWVHNKHLNADIEIRQRGIDELIHYSGNSLKLLLVADIENIIATAVGVGGGFEVNGKKGEKENVRNYFRLWNMASIQGVAFPFQVIIEQDELGLLHYDLILDSTQKAVMDNLSTPSDQSWDSSNNQNDFKSNDTNQNDESQDRVNLIIVDGLGQSVSSDEKLQTLIENAIKYKQNQVKNKAEQEHWRREAEHTVNNSGSLNDDGFSQNNPYKDSDMQLAQEWEQRAARLTPELQSYLIEQAQNAGYDTFQYGGNEAAVDMGYFSAEKTAGNRKVYIMGRFKNAPSREFKRNSYDFKITFQVGDSAKLKHSDPDDSVEMPKYTSDIKQAIKWGNDWLKGDLFGSLNDGTSHSVANSLQTVVAQRYVSSFDDVRELANQFKNKDLINEATGMIASVSGKTLDKMLSGKATGKSHNLKAHLMAVANVDYLFEKAITVDVHKDRAEDPNIKNIHRMVAKLTEKDGESLVKLMVKELSNNQGNRIYTVEAVEIENSTVPDIADADTQNEPTSTGHHGAAENNHTTNPAKQQVIDFLNDIINGKIDGMADGVLERLIELVEPFENDDEINQLAEKASAVIEAAMPKDIA